MKNNKNILSPPLGAHTSISGGVFNAIKHGQEIGADVVQIFSKNQRQWRGRWYSDEELEIYFRLREETGIEPLMVHDTYLINLASPGKETLEKSIAAFNDELQRTSVLKIPYLVTHPGSHTGSGEAAGIQQVAESLKRCWESAEVSDVIILLETTAGQGTNLGYKFEHLRDIIAFSEIERNMGVCIDTCHIFTAGYDIRTPETWENTLQEFDKIIGLSKLKAFHLNDSLMEFASRKDRHARIGRGEIGAGGFNAILSDCRVNLLPMILEIPGGNNAYREDLLVLRDLVSGV
jgi:deoxyribonuclease-4